MSIPVVRLTLERMEAHIVMALSEYELRLDADIREAVKAYCQPDNIKHVIEQQVRATLDRAIRAEVDEFYRIGAGRAVVREAVRKSLEREL